MLDIIEFLSRPYGLAAATALIFLAGLSDGVGTRTVGLLVNRITVRAFVLSLLASTLLFLLSAALWVWGAWFVATTLFGMTNALPHFFYVISAAYAPFLFGVLTLLPLVGPLIRVILRLWSFGIGFTVLASLGLTLGQAALSAGFGALLVAFVGWLLSDPAALLGQRLWATLVQSQRPPRSSDLPRVIPGYAPSDEIAP